MRIVYSFSFPMTKGRSYMQGFANLSFNAFKDKPLAYITAFELGTAGFNYSSTQNHISFRLGNFGVTSIWSRSNKIINLERYNSRGGASAPSTTGMPVPYAETTGRMIIILYNDNFLNNKTYFKNGPGSYDTEQPLIESVDITNPSLVLNIRNSEQSSRTHYNFGVSDYCEWTEAQVDANPLLPWTNPDQLARLLYNFPEEDNYQSSRKPFDKNFQAPGGLNVLPEVWLFKSTVDDSSWKDAVTRLSASPVRIHRRLIGGFFDNPEDCVYDVPR